MDFKNKLVLAPMVRVGSLPMRHLALKYGADIVYSPETVDKRLMTATRIVNPTLNTVDFIDAKSTLCLRTHASEKKHLIVQLGSACPILAVRAAKIVEQDCSAIDLNCGCPKKFSTLGNMGAELLTQPVLLCSILKALVDNINLPITCKIRVLDDMDKTVELVKMIAGTGISALAVHCRTKSMKSDGTRAMWEYIKIIMDAVDIPVIVNGDVFAMEDIYEIKQQSNACSFMLARAAQANPFIFKVLKRNGIADENDLHLVEVIKEYAKLAIEYDMPFQNAKYTLCQMSPPRSSRLQKEVCQQLNTPYFHGSMTKMKEYSELAEFLGIQKFHQDVLEKRAGSLKNDTGDYSSQYAYIPDGVVIPTKRKAADIE